MEALFWISGSFLRLVTSQATHNSYSQHLMGHTCTGICCSHGLGWVGEASCHAALVSVMEPKGTM